MHVSTTASKAGTYLSRQVMYENQYKTRKISELIMMISTLN